MKNTRLHTTTWVAGGLLLFALAYLNNSSQVEMIADYFADGDEINSQYLVFGWPRWFWFYGPFEWRPFLIDAVIWLFLLIGVAAIVETRTRRYGPPKISLLFVVGGVSSIAFYFNEGSSTDYGSPFFLEPFERINHFFFLLVTVAFGFAIGGWIQLLIWPFNRRTRQQLGSDGSPKRAIDP